MPKTKLQPSDADAVAVADLVSDLQGALAQIRRADGFGRITVDVTVKHGVITLWETASHVSRQPDYVRNRS